MAAPTATTSSGLTPLWGSRAGELLHALLHGGHAGHAAHQHDVVDLVAHARVGEGLLGGAHEALEQVVRQLLELRPRELQVEVLRAALVRRDERQVDLAGDVVVESSILAFSAAS